jgi:hypothetical protein
VSVQFGSAAAAFAARNVGSLTPDESRFASAGAAARTVEGHCRWGIVWGQPG